MNQEILTLPEQQPELRLVPLPAETNFFGDIFGGWVMSHVDLAGGCAAMRRARGRVATVAVNSFVFKQPVCIGDQVSFYTQVVKVGTTSITVDVQVYALRDPASPRVVKVTEAELSYVAMNADGTKRRVPDELPEEGTA